MQTTWILVANSTSAKLYSREDDQAELELSSQFEHPQSRQKGSDLVSDRPGHFQSKGTGHGAFVATSDPKENEAAHFANELAHMLDKGRKDNKYDKLVIVAPPHFCGLLNKQLDKHVQDKISGTVHKDYTHEEARALLSHLQEHLAH